LPRWFLDDIKAIDQRLYLVWHPFHLIWDNVMNQYTGSMEDPRFNIHEYCGQEIWGWPLTDGKGKPTREDKWHLWRLNTELGWYHVMNIASDDPGHLKKVVRELWWQAKIADAPMAAKSMVRKMKMDEDDELEAQQKARDDLFNDTMRENKSFLREVQSNFECGRTAPTNPQKESIISFPGQKNFTKTVRPLDDKEGGLYIPGDD
jgi:hypothetical protein